MLKSYLIVFFISMLPLVELRGAIPVGIGLLGGSGGLLLTSRGAALYFPYSLLCLGMRANNPQMELPLLPFLAACAIFIALFAWLSIRLLCRRDAVTG